jgi:hypothetical protein
MKDEKADVAFVPEWFGVVRQWEGIGVASRQFTNFSTYER